VDLEEVPSESQRLLQNATNNLHKAWTNLQRLERQLSDKMSDVETKEEVLGICEEARKSLAAADSTILDASMIAAGYYQAHEPQLEEVTKEPEQAAQEQPREAANVPEG